MDQAQRPVRLPLSRAQLSMYFAQQLDVASPSYTMAEYTDIEGPVDQDIFVAAAQAMYREVDAVHAHFVEDEVGIGQVLGEPDNCVVSLVDLSAEPDPDAAAVAWMRRELGRPFDLSRPPLLTNILFRLGGDRFRWYKSCHHILMDAFAVPMLTRRAGEFYLTLAKGQELSASPFGRLAETLAKESRYWASERCTADRAFWHSYLGDRHRTAGAVRRPGVPPCVFLRHTKLLTGAYERALCTSRHDWRRLALIAGARIARQWSTGDDVVIGLPVAARPGLVGQRTPAMLVNVLPLRMNVGPAVTGDLVAEVNQQMRRVAPHTRYRYEDIRRDLRLFAIDEHLFRVKVNVMGWEDSTAFAGWRAMPHVLSNGPVDDLSFTLYRTREGIRVNLDVNPELHHAEESAGLIDEFVASLTSLVG